MNADKSKSSPSTVQCTSTSTGVATAAANDTAPVNLNNRAFQLKAPAGFTVFQLRNVANGDIAQTEEATISGWYDITAGYFELCEDCPNEYTIEGVK